MKNENLSGYISKSMNRYISIVILILILLALIYIPPLQRKLELQSNREKWTLQNVRHYKFDVEIGCFCNFQYRMPVTIEIQDEQIVSILDATGKALLLGSSEALPFERVDTMEGLFALVQRGIDEADVVNTKYDSQYGFPTVLYIDWVKAGSDDEFTYTVTNFQVLP